MLLLSPVAASFRRSTLYAANTDEVSRGEFCSANWLESRKLERWKGRERKGEKEGKRNEQDGRKEGSELSVQKGWEGEAAGVGWNNERKWRSNECGFFPFPIAMELHRRYHPYLYSLINVPVRCTSNLRDISGVRCPLASAIISIGLT